MGKNKRGDWAHAESLRLQAELTEPNPSGLCQCGCGAETPLAPVTMQARGWVRGKHVRFCHGHSGGKKKRQLGEKKLSPPGYVLVWQPDHPRSHMGWVAEHILVMEDKIGRPVLARERIHHEDRNRANNHPNNLTLLGNQADHLLLHAREDKKWCRNQPHLTGCILCGRSDVPHRARGLCRSCYHHQTGQ